MYKRRWWLGGTRGVKVIHVAGCPSARVPYDWANRQGDARGLAWALIDFGAYNGHRPCKRCNNVLADALAAEWKWTP